MSSLKQLKDTMVAKGGYNITPQSTQLVDLKTMINNLITVRSVAPPGTVEASSNAGTTCVGHDSTPYSGKLSLGNLKDRLATVPAKTCTAFSNPLCGCVTRTGCACNAYTAACDCNTRTYGCSCNGHTWSCDCNNRTYSCSCNAYSSVCTCNGRTATSCDCLSRGPEVDCPVNADNGFYLYACMCNTRTTTCDCKTRTATPTCSCNGRTGSACDCQSRTSSCGSRDQSDSSGSYNCGSRDQTDTSCGSRTSSCGTVVSSCVCNGRCACNTEERFG